jgi:beta-galactosidase
MTAVKGPRRVGLCAALVVISVGVVGVTSSSVSSAAAPASVSTALSDVGPSGSGSGDQNLGVLNQGARTINFDSGWRFKLVNTSDTTDPSGRFGNSSDPKASAENFNDSSWQPITTSHDWSITQLPQPSQTNATGYFPGGLGWYRKEFTLPSSMTGKRISIDFDGVFDNSYVYLNGKLLGNHPYGYTGYSFDVSNLVHTDGVTRNVLAVVVQNMEPSSRWYSGSGITRHVHLTVVDPIHVARWGTFVTTPQLATTIHSGYADVHVATNVANDSGQNVVARLDYKIMNAGGTVVAQSAATGVAVPADGASSSADIRVDHPNLWSTTNPYLYRVETEIVVGGTTVDSTSTTFGVRWLVFDPNKGVLLNGEPIKLRGVDLHNDEGALGSVDNYDALWRQMSLLKRMGVNAFRTSHNPPSPEMIDVCQRLGIVMMVEAFDAWDVGKLAQDYHLYFNQWSDYDIKEMVNEAKNSPAVIMWSIGNEIPDWTSASALPIEQRLIAGIKSIDTTRPIVAGSDKYRSVPASGSVADQMVQSLDGLGVNYDTAQTVDALHAKYPTKFFSESESSSEASTRGYYQDPNLLNTGQNFTPGKQELSSYDNNMASWTMSDEYGLKKDRDRPFYAGEFIWSGFDYIGEPTPYTTFPVKTSFFGTIDTAGFPKDAYYLFKSQWNPTPMVHILPMNWTDYRRGQTVQVWAYANEPTVELFLNGVSLGARSFDQKTTAAGQRYLETTQCTGDDKNYTAGACPGSYESPNGSSGKLHLSWNVPFKAGKLVAIAKDASGRVVARDEEDTAGAPYALRLSPDKRVLLDDGNSLSYVTVQVLDAHGVEVPDADNTINLSVAGAGSFQGADNGKQDDAEGYKANSHTAFNGKLLAIIESDTRPGPIRVTASADGLLPATTTLYSSGSPGRGLIAIEPVSLRSRLGDQPALPATVQGVRAEGSTERLRVSWSTVPSHGRAHAGIYTVDGAVAGTTMTAQADLTVYRVAGIQRSATSGPPRARPALPSAVRVAYSDGVTQQKPVSWAPIPPKQYATPRLFSVTGRITGIRMPVQATVRIARRSAASQDIALASGPMHPTADASFSGGVFADGGSDAGTSTTVPAAMLDGNTTSGGWSNRYSKAATQTLAEVTNSHPNDWVSVSWPHPQSFAKINVYFTIDSADQLPASVVVTYWNGLEWVQVKNQHEALASDSDAPSTITFDTINTTNVKLDMTSAAPNNPVTGNLTITEIKIPAPS